MARYSNTSIDVFEYQKMVLEYPRRVLEYAGGINVEQKIAAFCDKITASKPEKPVICVPGCCSAVTDDCAGGTCDRPT